MRGVGLLTVSRCASDTTRLRHSVGPQCEVLRTPRVLDGEVPEGQLGTDNLEMENGAIRCAVPRTSVGTVIEPAYGPMRTENGPGAINFLSGAPHGNGKTK